MKVKFGLRVVLALLAGGSSARAQQTGSPSTNTVLKAEFLSFHDWKEDEKPEPGTTFVVGETAVFVTRIAGFGLKKDGLTPEIDAAYTLRTPDGKSHPLSSEFKAEPLVEAGQIYTVIRPILPIQFTQENHPTGCYFMDVALTDTVTRATAEAHIPVFVFLTPGSKELISGPRPDAPVALDNTLLSPGFWDLSKDEIAAAFWAIGLQWTSVDQKALRAVARKATFQGRSISDVQIQFEAETPSEVKLFVYNRGDEGLVTEDVFTATTKAVIADLTRWAEKPPQDLTPKSGGQPGQKSTILCWKGASHFLRLEHAISAVRQENVRGRLFQPEYISLTLLPVAQRTLAGMVGREREQVSSYSLVQRVVRDPSGDVYLDVPMHDQGEKGYCAAAAAERILDFYGASISQHEIAQRIQMGSQGATFEGILRGLRSLTAMLRLQLRVLMESDDKVFLKWVEEYNKMAKRDGKLQIDLTKPLDPDYGPKTIWEMFDKDLFLKSRIRTPIPVNRFFDQCKGKIDLGIPLIQTCMIGILPEEAKLGQDPGGHARLIIGCNVAKKEILYSDSWGLGHERKRMPLDHAYAITTGLLTIEPR